MKKILSLLFLLLPLSLIAQLHTVSNSIYYNDPVNSTMEVFLTGASTVNISYTGTAQGAYQWYEFNTSGSASPISGANSTTLMNASSDKGYYITIGGNPTGRYVWVSNYAAALPHFESLNIPNTDDACTYTTLDFVENAPDAYYYTKAGLKVTIVRKFKAIYTTLDKDKAEKGDFTPITANVEISSNKKVPAPFLDTTFKIVDDYAQQLGLDASITSPETYQAVAVVSHVKEEIEAREANNQVATEDGTYSAPMQATFTAVSNEPVAAFFVWTIYKDGATEPVVRYTDRTLRYTFEESGSYIVNLEVNDRTSKCFAEPYQFTCTIVESFIDIPNVFSPGTSPGVNDEFKVAYKSITKFKAYITNRWGQKLFEWSDPAQGWDGRFGGKLVPSGVYFYVIEWEGADGRSKVEKGHINILGGK